MAYAQWVVIYLRNRSKVAIKITNVSLKWGKFHADDNKAQEIPVSDIEGQVIKPGKTFRINSCGRENAASGTEGSFDVFDNDNHRDIRNISWDCPWGAGTNSFRISGEDEDWVVGEKGANLDSGALGNVTVTLAKLS